MAKLKRLGDEYYEATTPKGRVFRVEKSWQLGGWVVRPKDGTPLGEEGVDAIHEPRLADVRKNLDNGFYDRMYDMNEGEADPDKWKVYEPEGVRARSQLPRLRGPIATGRVRVSRPEHDGRLQSW